MIVAGSIRRIAKSLFLNRQVRQERQGAEEIGTQTARFSTIAYFSFLGALGGYYDFAVCQEK